MQREFRVFVAGQKCNKLENTFFFFLTQSTNYDFQTRLQLPVKCFLSVESGC